MAQQKILILGGGFGGIKAALELADRPEFTVSLLSDKDYFDYHGRLYYLATGGSRRAVVIPLKEIFAGKKVRLIRAEAKQVDRRSQLISTNQGEKYAYDRLVIALGSATNYFGIKGLKDFAFSFKSLDDAQKLRRHLHSQLMAEHKPDLNYVIVGGGATGLEVAGALPGFIGHIMRCHGLPARPLNIKLVEAAGRLMPAMPRGYSRAVHKQLSRLGVEVYLNQKVEAETADTLMVSGQSIASHSVVWTAGISNHPFMAANDFKLSEHGRVLVDEFLQAESNIYVIGDNADTKYCGMAQTALHNAKFVAENLGRQAAGLQPLAYRPKKPIYITPVGPKWAAVLWGSTQIYGRFGWWLRRLADLAAYHELEPLWKARQHWLTDTGGACPTCDA
ncbi:FAD-dependent oxidoreductase [Candidatus Saccharibacteria bacterium]|nr:FAD-dependent oxidoreductase [Candidatus Saccharibacteria bacterium]